MKKKSQRAEARQQGFEDALVIGRPNPVQMSAGRRLSYDEGFKQGQRAVTRIVERVQAELGHDAKAAIFDERNGFKSHERDLDYFAALRRAVASYLKGLDRGEATDDAEIREAMALPPDIEAALDHRTAVRE